MRPVLIDQIDQYVEFVSVRRSRPCVHERVDALERRCMVRFGLRPDSRNCCYGPGSVRGGSRPIAV